MAETDIFENVNAQIPVLTEQFVGAACRAIEGALVDTVSRMQTVYREASEAARAAHAEMASLTHALPELQAQFDELRQGITGYRAERNSLADEVATLKEEKRRIETEITETLRRLGR